METSEWFRHLHGASTHFPIALTCLAVLVEGAGLRQPVPRPETRRMSLWLLGVGCLGALAAVASGLVRSRGEIGGSGLAWQHHACVWPAFALLVGLLYWRWRIGEGANRPALVWFALGLFLAAGCLGAAGYFGSELARLH